MGQKTGKPILVVEDIAEIALHMKRRLIERGYEVIWTEDAEGAIQIAEQSALSIILTDLDLPTLDSLVERMSKHGQLKELPVAILDLNQPELNNRRIKVLIVDGQRAPTVFDCAFILQTHCRSAYRLIAATQHPGKELLSQAH